MSRASIFKNPVNRVAAALLLVSLAMAAFTARKLDMMRPEGSLDEVLYLQSPRVVKFMSLGYTGLAASIYWTRAVQYFGTKHFEKAKGFDLLPKLLDLTVDLDPHLIPAYSFGAIFLAQQPPEGAGMPDKAVEFVERGIRENPDYWRLYYNLGFIHFIERHDYKAAAEAFERGSKVPGANPAIKTMAALMEQRAGNTQTARLLWNSIYESTEEPAIRKNALTRLVALKVDEDVWQLESAVRMYQQRKGKFPESWQDLRAEGLLRGVPTDPSGEVYKLSPDGRVLVQDPQKFPFIQRGLPQGQSAVETITPESQKVVEKAHIAPK
jgi:tetratricopeptide (TPR) repeat protein